MSIINVFRFTLKRGKAVHCNFFIHREVRSVAKRERQSPKLLKGRVVTLDDDTAEKFGPIKSYEQLNRTLKKMFVQPDEIQSERELAEGEDFGGVIQNAHQFLDIHKREEADFRRSVRKQITKKNYFKQPKETNLLTHAAKTQIRYLHQLDPMEWTPEKLAESFPASVVGIKKLLKSNSLWTNNEENIKKNDEDVAKRWEWLKSNRNLSLISPVTLRLWREGKLIQDFYAGNVNLPQPPPPKVKIQEKPKKIGEHAAIVKNYLDYKKQKENKLAVLEKSNNEKLEKQQISNFDIKYPTRSEVEDQESASYLAVEKNDPYEPDVLPDQFESNLMDDVSSKKHKTDIDQAYEQWLKGKSIVKESNEIQPYDCTSFVTEIKKFNNDNIELSRSDVKNKTGVAYLYNPDTGYQHPFGKNIIQGRIKIPSHLRKKGAIYKVGLCYYDDRGQFLYKLPVELNVDSL